MPGLPHEAKLFPRGLVPAGIPLWVCHFCLVGTSPVVIWSPPLFELILGPGGQDSGTGQCQPLCLTSLELPLWSDNVLFAVCGCIYWTSVHGSGQSVCKGQLPPA